MTNMRIANLLLAAGILALSACSDSRMSSANAPNDRAPTYSNNGSYDDNGAEPPPNNGNQNFGAREQ